jgi:transposase
MERYYVGLDVHSRESVFVIKRADDIIARGTIPTTPAGLERLRAAHQLPPGTPVALETGTSAFFVARELARLEFEPRVIDAHEVRRKALRPQQKSDTRDALELCEGLSRGFYRSVVHIPSPAISTLRTTLSRRRHFVRLQVAEVNAVKRLLRGVGREGGRRGSLRTDAHWTRLQGHFTRTTTYKYRLTPKPAGRLAAAD